MEPLSHLDRVADRLNWLALQRAAYRTAGLALLSAAFLAPAALWLSSRAFLALAVVLVTLALAVGVGSFWVLRARWARRIEAARWVEHEVDLEERLLTLVTAPDEARGMPLWAELEQDNRQQLGRWQDEKLGIPRVPANVLLLMTGILAALLALAPGGGDPRQPPPPPGFLQPPEEPPKRSDAVPQTGTAESELSGAGAGEGEGDPEGIASSTISQVKTRLGERFARSLAASALGGGTQSDESDGERATRMRGDLPESELGDSLNQEGGMTPPEAMAHIIQDDADDGGEIVRRFEAEGGGAKTGSSQGGVRKGEAPEQDDVSERPADGDGELAERDPDDPVLVSENASEVVAGSGGSGPGNSPGTGPLLADAPLDLKGGRAVARFSLALGAMADKEGGEGGTMDADMSSDIAEGERGEQEADAGVRHESIPPEYETVIKRVFERNT